MRRRASKVYSTLLEASRHDVVFCVWKSRGRGREGGGPHGPLSVRVWVGCRSFFPGVACDQRVGWLGWFEGDDCAEDDCRRRQVL